MNIVWQYLDKKSATIDVLKDYESMEFIIESTDDKIKDVEDNMISVASTNFSGMPRSNNTNGNESRIVNSINEIDILKERYRQASEYMNWFLPAWNKLNEEEQFILTEFYITDDINKTDAVQVICDKYKIERSSTYNKKNRAVQKLAVLLYGK